jgi:hypothetical protein
VIDTELYFLMIFILINTAFLYKRKKPFFTREKPMKKLFLHKKNAHEKTLAFKHFLKAKALRARSNPNCQ